MSILLIAGSPGTPSRSARLLEFIGSELTKKGHEIDRVYVRGLPTQSLLHADFEDRILDEAFEKVAHAYAIVIGTPVYKAAYSGILKAFLDLLPQDGLKGKFVLPIATGGSAAHMLALDYALRPVLTSLAAQHILPGLYITDRQIQWSSEIGLKLDLDIEIRLLDSVERLNNSVLSLFAEQDKQRHHISSVAFTDVRCSV